MAKQFSKFIQITKVDEATRTVSGLATAELPDKSGEVFDYDTSLPYYKAWSDEIHKASGGKSLGNIREMHTNIAAGKVTKIHFNDVEKQIEITAKIVNEATWEKVVEGVLTGFSHGGSYIKTWQDPNDKKLTRYTAEPSEISVVDNPCLGEATFNRADGTSSMIKFKAKEADPELNADGKPVQPKYVPEQVWKASDGQTFAKKEDWRVHQLKLETVAEDDPLAGLKKALAQKELESNPDYDPMTLGKKDFSDAKRKEMAAAGTALPDGSFPIDSVEDLRNAIHAYGRAADPAKAKAHIIARAKALGAENEIPNDWKKKKKTVSAETMQKLLPLSKSSTYDVKMALEALVTVECLLWSEEWEQLCGEGEMEQVIDLKEIISRLKSFISSEITENDPMAIAEPMSAEFMEMAAKDKGLTKFETEEDSKHFAATFKEILIKHLGKAGARHSAADKGQLGKAMDALDEAKDHHEDAVKAHGKMGDAHGDMRKTMGAMADCMKVMHVSLQKGSLDTEKGLSTLALGMEKAEKDMKGHLDDMDGHMDKAEKHHGKMGKAHDGMAAAHDTIGHSLKAVGAEKPGDDDAEKVAAAELKKVQDELVTVKTENETLTKDNTSVKEELGKLKTRLDTEIPELMERVNKLALLPAPAKGALYDTGGQEGIKPVLKGHDPNKPAGDVEAPESLTRGASPEQMRAILGLKH